MDNEIYDPLIGEQSKATREAFRSKKRQLTDIIEFLPDATLAIDTTGHVIIWNKAIEKMTGIPAAEMIGKGDYVYTIPLYGDAHPILLDLVFRNDETILNRYNKVNCEDDSFTTEVFCPALNNNKGAWIFAKASPLHDQAGNIIGAIESIRDITEAKNAEEALRSNQRQLTDIIEFLPDATFAIDMTGYVIIWNKAIEEMTGVPAAEMIGKGDYAYAVPFYGEAHQGLLDLVALEDEKIADRYTNVHRKGDSLTAEVFCPALNNNKGAWIFAKASPLHDQAGNIIGAIESMRDITEAKNAEEALRSNQRQLTDIIEFLPDATLAIDTTGHIITWNKAIEEMTGVPAAEMIGKGDYAYAVPFYGEAHQGLLDLVALEDEKIADRYTNVHRKGDSLTAEVFCPALNNNKGAWIYAKASPLHDQAGNIIGAIESMRDITEAKNANEEKEKRAAELIKANKDLAYLKNNLELLVKERVAELVIANKELTFQKKEKEKQFKELVLTEKSLRSKERQLTDIIEFLPDATAAIDMTGHVILWNAAIEKMTGIPAAEMIGKGDYAYVIPYYGEARPALLDLVFQSDEEIVSQYPNLVREGDALMTEVYCPALYNNKGAWIFAKASPLHDQAGNMIGAIESLRDITETKNAEEEKEKRNSELIEANNYLKKSLINFKKLTEAVIGAITIIVEKRDPYTAGHQLRVSKLACAIAKEMGLDESFIEGIRIAGLMHDVGKIAIPSEILSKPGRISEVEFELIKVHPKASYEILKDIDFNRPIADIVLQHHERLDGSGYPNGLKGDEISIDARILNVADVVEAMSSYRPYRPALGLDQALIEIQEHKGTLYDEVVVNICTRLLTSRSFEF